MEALLDKLVHARVSPAAARRFRIPKRIAYVVSHSLPFSSNGYAVRTHGVATALAASGFEVFVFTRPGLPWDLPGFEGAGFRHHHRIDAIDYVHLRRPAQGGAGAFGASCIDTYEELYRVYKVAAVVAASNYETALPALIAARQERLPFVYEVRGFWEISQVSRQPSWHGSDEFRRQVRLESAVARAADRVITLNRPMAEELARRGVSADRIGIVPNAVAALPAAAAKDAALARAHGLEGGLVVGYIGSLSAYEGLEDLVLACARLRQEGLPVKLLVVGSSNPLGVAEGNCSFMERLRALAAEAGFAGHLALTGRVAHERIAQFYALADVIALPRKPDPVSELVLPIKPVEALAHGRPLVVSDVAPLAELAAESGLAETFRKGDVADLARALRAALAAGANDEFGVRARAWVAEHRLWSTTVAPLVDTLRDLMPGAVPSAPTAARESAPVEAAPAPQPPAGEPKPASAPAAAQTKTSKPLFDESISIADLYRERGHDFFVDAIVAKYGRRPAAVAKQLLGVSKSLREAGMLQAEYALGSKALEYDRAPQHLRAFFWIALRADKFVDCRRTLDELERQGTAGEGSAESLAKFHEAYAQRLANTEAVRALDEVGARAPTPIESIAGRVCYVVHNTLPYSSGGYATRSHGVAMGLLKAGWDVVALSRPGYPLDIRKELAEADVPAVDIVDGVSYVRTLQPKRSGLSATRYMLAAADAVEARLREFRPAIVIAASNHTTSLPALIAARRLALPFIYEIRGLWEITRSSRDKAFQETAAFLAMRALETGVAAMADHVFTLTEPIREELAVRGVPAERVDLLPNSCDPTRFRPIPRDVALAARLGIPAGVPVVGYVGTFVDYEGLEDLAQACALMKVRGTRFRLLMVGNENASGEERGPISDRIVQVAFDHRFSDWLIMPGRVPHEEVESYYSLIDVAPFPRKPWPVCEMVSPIKPLEALAMEKAVVVSSVRALTEMIGDGETGLVFEKGNVASLAAVLQRLIDDEPLRRRLGANGRRWVEKERTWEQAGRMASDRLAKLLEARP